MAFRECLSIIQFRFGHIRAHKKRVVSDARIYTVFSLRKHLKVLKLTSRAMVDRGKVPDLVDNMRKREVLEWELLRDRIALRYLFEGICILDIV